MFSFGTSVYQCEAEEQAPVDFYPKPLFLKTRQSEAKNWKYSHALQRLLANRSLPSDQVSAVPNPSHEAGSMIDGHTTD